MSPLWVCLEPLEWEKVLSIWGERGWTFLPPKMLIPGQCSGAIRGRLLTDWITMENEGKALVQCGHVPCWWPQQIPQGCGDFLWDGLWASSSSQGYPFSNLFFQDCDVFTCCHSSGCYDKIPQTGWHTKYTFISHTSVGRKSKIKVPTDLVSDEDLLPGL